MALPTGAKRQVIYNGDTRCPHCGSMETNEYVMQCEDPKKVQYGPSIFIMRDSNLEQDISRATSDPGVAHLYETYHVKTRGTSDFIPLFMRIQAPKPRTLSGKQS